MQAVRTCQPQSAPHRATEKVWVRKYMFGYRIQVSNPDPDGGFEADYCCGMETYVIGLVSMMAQVALQNGHHASDLPRQVVKPIWNDQPCFQALAVMAGCTKEEIQAFFKSYPTDRMDARRL